MNISDRLKDCFTIEMSWRETALTLVSFAQQSDPLDVWCWYLTNRQGLRRYALSICPSVHKDFAFHGYYPFGADANYRDRFLEHWDEEACRLEQGKDKLAPYQRNGIWKIPQYWHKHQIEITLYPPKSMKDPR